DREHALLRGGRSARTPPRRLRVPGAERSDRPRRRRARVARAGRVVHGASRFRAALDRARSPDAVDRAGPREPRAVNDARSSTLPARWRAELPALGLLSVLVALLFRSTLMLGRAFYQRDVHAYFLPLDALLKRTVGEGHWPLWNPYLAFGQPMLAN